ncbi:hypothetical protein BX666DRAFT_1914761 [Dichotomocladium elegans]|nr:hypothetical protein BX666DRAFT_1914761 [Dichotomocladium elegans]
MSNLLYTRVTSFFKSRLSTLFDRVDSTITSTNNHSDSALEGTKSGDDAQKHTGATPTAPAPIAESIPVKPKVNSGNIIICWMCGSKFDSLNGGRVCADCTDDCRSSKDNSDSDYRPHDTDQVVEKSDDRRGKIYVSDITRHHVPKGVIKAAILNNKVMRCHNCNTSQSHEFRWSYTSADTGFFRCAKCDRFYKIRGIERSVSSQEERRNAEERPRRCGNCDVAFSLRWRRMEYGNQPTYFACQACYKYFLKYRKPRPTTYLSQGGMNFKWIHNNNGNYLRNGKQNELHH